MTGTLKRYVTLLVGTLVLTIWASTGCETNTEMSEDDQMPSGNDGTSREGIDTEEAPEWPDGWMVVNQPEWIPILDELGRRLHAARGAFLSGNRRDTIENIRQGIVYLEAQVPDSSERDRTALTTATTILRAIMRRFADGEEVTVAQLDIAFANAYFSDLERENLVVETGSTVRYLEQPESHLQLAIEHFLAGDSEGAARDIDRASAYLYLEGHRLGLSERAELNEAAQNLERLAARLRIVDIQDRAELDRVFEPAIRSWRQHAIAPTRPPSLGLMSQ